MTLAYPQEGSGAIPSRIPGEAVTLQVLVLNDERDPVEGARVYWSDGRAVTALSETASSTDTAGIAQTTWFMAPLEANQSTARREVSVALPGAFNNPLTYRVEVRRCTRCGGNEVH
jgi:hypothetical protein